MKQREATLRVLCLFVFMLLLSCKQEGQKETHMANAHVLFIESNLNAIAARNPDSAEILLKNGVHYCDSLNHEEGLLKIHSLLAEFYQYWIISDGLAYYHMNEAINIYLRNPQYRIYDPYFYTDLGNIQLKFGHYEQALESYRSAAKTSENVGSVHGQILSSNNIGQLWQYAGNYDSADYYFQKSLHIIGDKGSLNKAQIYYFQMKLNALQGKKDSLHYFFNLIEESPHEYIKLKEGSAKLDANEKRYFWQVKGSARLLMAGTKKGEERKWLLRDAVQNAVSSRDPILIYTSYLALGNELLEAGLLAQAGLIADTLESYTQLIYNPEPLIHIYEFCNRAALRNGDNEKAGRAAALLKQMQDSLLVQNSGQELLKMRMKISAVNAHIAVENMKLASRAGEKIISQQKVIIILLISAIVLSAMIIISIRLFRKRLNFANRMLALKTARIASEDYTEAEVVPVKDSISVPGIDGLAHRLDQLNRENQPYLNPSLTLSDLASMLGTNQTYMSAFINQQLGLNFNDYLNNLRVQHASKLLINPDNRYSMEQIFEMSGFNSKSTFYTAFKKHAGVSPAAFVKLNRVNKHT